ncbi:MAG: hypothetical protein K9L62_10950 [Vallitaleaceae bacterium]|nr:hypothetical protein [Vallitaleaceae bacterium]
MTNKICDYGCGHEATHQFKNGKWCCSKFSNSCPKVRKKRSISSKGRSVWNKGKIMSCEHIEKIRKGKVGKPLSLKHKQKISLTKKLSIKYIKKTYNLFSKIEEMRYNPHKPDEKEIQVHCKNHNCKNSKEHGGWFTPTGIQLYERIRQLEKEYGNGGSYLYCCDECKNECPLYNIYSDPYQESLKSYTESEYQQFREYVLKRDNHKCQYCGEKAEHVHHERPQKLEPFYALDPDFAWSCCEKCHYEKGHKDECSTGKLASINCI